MDEFYFIDEEYSYKSQLERRCELRKNISFINLFPKEIKKFRFLYGWY